MMTMLHNKIYSRLLIALPLFILFLQACKKYSPFSYIKPEISITASDSRLTNETIHFSKDTVYVLAVSLTRDSGQQLIVDAGTLIKVNDYVSITIQPGAMIQAKGTTTDPIIFTSSAAKGSAGVGPVGNGGFGLHTWKGIRIFGNTGVSTEGSGTMSYVRIEFAGGDGYGNPSLPYYGSLLLNNVTRATSIEHIQVSYSFLNPSFEFAGGDCEARYLVSYASVAADFNLHQGYTGKLQHLLAYRHPYFPDPASGYAGGALAGMLIQDNTTLPSISNLTVVGPDPASASSKYFQTSRVASFIAFSGAKFHIRNSILMGFPKTGWRLDDQAVAAGVADNSSDLKYSILQCDDSSRAFYLAPGTFNPYDSHSFRNYLLQPSFGNQLFIRVRDFNLTDPYNYNVSPNPMPLVDSTLLSGANFDAPFDDAFFNKVNYRGALGADNWLKDWTNFIPLLTNYNSK